MPRYAPALDGMDFDDCIELIVDAVELNYPHPTTEDYFQGYKHAVHIVLGSLMQDSDQFNPLLERIFPKPLIDPHPAVTIAKVRKIDTEGMLGRDKHPPVITAPEETVSPRGHRYHKRYSPINGQEVVILRPVFVMVGVDDTRQYDLRLESEFYTVPDELPETGTNQTWFYEALVISGEYKGQIFELVDYELED